MRLQNNVGVCLHQEITVCHTDHNRAIPTACKCQNFMKNLCVFHIHKTRAEMQAKRVSLFDHSAMLNGCLTGRGHNEQANKPNKSQNHYGDAYNYK